MQKLIEAIRAKLNSFRSGDNGFVYPTRNNLIAMLLMFQLVPLIIFSMSSAGISFWIKSEIIILGILCAWPSKPQELLTVEDREVETKWVNRMFACSLPCVIFPIALLWLDDTTTAWSAFTSFALPVFVIICLFSAMIRVGQGGFFSPGLPSTESEEVEAAAETPAEETSEAAVEEPEEKPAPPQPMKRPPKGKA